jgi:hypothetical protein
MPNHITTRLTLAGPTDALDRFLGECVRVAADEGREKPTLDFETLVPTPEVIRATLDKDASEDAPRIAEEQTGHDGWYMWRVANWGSKWNSYEFDGGRISDTIYDCTFSTAWGCPQPVIRALAARFPMLCGTVVSGDPCNDWSVIGAFRNGVYRSTSCDFDPQIELLSSARFARGSFPGESARALIDELALPGLLIGEDGHPSASGSAARVLEGLWQRVGCEVRDCFLFEQDAEELIRIIDEDGIQAAVDQVSSCSPSSARNAAFLLEQDRLRTRLDRDLVEVLAWQLRDEALCRAELPEVAKFYHHRVTCHVLQGRTHDDLCDWACVAMYRPDIVLDLTSEDALRESVLTYADHLRRDVLDHLRNSAAAYGGPLPAAA